MKQKKIPDETYIYLLKYFDGDIINLNKKDIKDLDSKNKKNKLDEKIPDKVMNKFKLIFNDRNNVDVKWNYPIWYKDESEIFKKKGEFNVKFEEVKKESKKELKEVVVKKDIKELKLDENSYILSQRKAFIKWINENFYRMMNEKLSEDDRKDMQKYQRFAKHYLGLETPYKGLLIYHGLGTGKTATSIITASGLSKEMNIFTFLPASLETEYINEVKKWGDVIFNIESNYWVPIKLSEIQTDKSLEESLIKDYNITDDDINNIFLEARRKVKNINISRYDSVKDVKQKEKMIEEGILKDTEELTEIKGFFNFLQLKDLKDENEIYTYNGEILKKDEKTSKTDITEKIKELSEMQKLYINQQITYLIERKYNFIHYDGFPKILDGQVEDKFSDNPKLLKKKTHNQEMALKLKKLVQYNYSNYNMKYSPFKNNVIIIDEVHNFVRLIVNNSGPAIKFYEWILNSRDSKFIFLSGTPIINVPSEVAILFNMLKGMIKIYNFSIKINVDEYELTRQLREVFYTSNSSVEQLFVSKYMGKMVISFIKNSENFESVMDKDKNIIYTIKFNKYSDEEFINEIYKKLHTLYDDKLITPSERDFKKLKTKNRIFRGDEKIFDEELDLVFNRHQKLFDIYEGNRKIDLSNNDNFMDYFFDENTQIPIKKQTLLRRMLMGLTSYYPIDRSSITDMPSIKDSEVIPLYKDYLISKDINIVPCYMSSIQWANYEKSYNLDKMKRLKSLNKKSLYNSENFDYYIHNRQICNFVYEDDSFRKRFKKNVEEETEELDEKKAVYKKLIDSGQLNRENLKFISPKFYNMMNNIDKFLNRDIPTGKILYYSSFRGDSGSEILEQILINNGYERYNHDSQNINDLISSKLKRKRFTFITGQESLQDRKNNKEAFNHIENLKGEYIQIILISSAGAEGISLKAVRQVHIMEPYWNYIRMNQVFGRAIRMKSHEDLLEKDRNVEQYLYLSLFPEGETIETILASLKSMSETWPELEKLVITGDIKQELVSKYPSILKLINKILSVKLETKNRTVDQILFDIMEKKMKINSKIMNIIKESSVDCIDNTKDEPIINNKCLRFSEKLQDEEAFYPGININSLNKIDYKQFDAKFIYDKYKPIYIISALENNLKKYIYYKIDIKDKDDLDVRYIRENGLRIGDLDLNEKRFYNFEDKYFEINKLLGNKFSVYQTIYNIDNEDINNDLLIQIMPNINKLKNDIIGYKVKFNLADNFYFYLPKIIENQIIRLYDYKKYIENNFIPNGKTIIIRNNNYYLSNN